MHTKTHMKLDFSHKKKLSKIETFYKLRVRVHCIQITHTFLMMVKSWTITLIELRSIKRKYAFEKKLFDGAIIYFKNRKQQFSNNSQLLRTFVLF